MSSSTKSEAPVTKLQIAVAPAMPAASIDDTAAYLRASPCLVAVLDVAVPAGVRARGATFAQQDLRKLDGDLGPEADRALRQLQRRGARGLASDLGPTATLLQGLDSLVERREQSTAVLSRMRALMDYAETQQRVFDHDTVLILEAGAEAVAFLGQVDDAMRDRYSATLDVLAARTAKATEGRARARAAAATATG